MRTSDGAGTGDFTYLVISAPVASATKEMMACCQNGAQEFYFVANFNVAGATVSGNLSAQTNVGGASGLNAAGAVDGKPHVYVYTRKVNGGACDAVLYSDGIALASGTVNRVQMWSGSSSDYISGYTGSGWGGSSPTSLMLGWNRALSADEVIEVSRNPWQLFEAIDDWDEPAAAATGGDVGEVCNSTDSCGVMLVSAVAVAEALATMEAQICAAAAERGVSEATAVASLVGSGASMAVGCAEIASASDTADASTAAVVAAIHESASGADVAGVQQQAAAAVSEIVASADSTAETTAMGAAQAEAGAAIDTVGQAGAVIPAAVEETVSAADAVGASAMFMALLADAGAAGDALSAALSAAAAMSELAPGADVAIGTQAVAIGLGDLLAALEACGAAVPSGVVPTLTRFVVASENRLYVVAPDDRRYVISAEPRTYTVN